MRKKTKEEYAAEIAIKNSTVELIGDYLGANIKTTFHCIIHDELWETTPAKVLKGCGCPTCHLERCWYSRRKSPEQYIKEVKEVSPFIDVIGTYINAKTPIAHYCQKHGIEWNSLPSSVLSGSGCSKCTSEKISSKQLKSHEQYEEELKAINPNIEVMEPYINSSTPILHLHKSCGHITKMYPYSALAGKGCIFCKGIKIGNIFRKSNDKFLSEMQEINPSIEVLGEYINSQTKIQCKCIQCGNIWSAKPSHLLQGHGCPMCTKSLGEKYIKLWLERNNISFVHDIKYDGLYGVGGGLLSYDFYLDEFNVLIEFQGEQHDIPKDMFGGEEKFKIQQEHDRRKREYALIRNIPLLEISYKDLKNINNILEKFINNLKLETVTTTGVA